MTLNLHRLFITKVILVEEQEYYNLTHSWEDKDVHKTVVLNGEIPKFQQTESGSQLGSLRDWTQQSPKLNSSFKIHQNFSIAIKFLKLHHKNNSNKSLCLEKHLVS